MTQYSSIRIYIKSSIISNSGFYDVIGYYGNTPTTSNGTVLIDVSNECYPLIKSNNKYYYLAYSNEGYIPNDTIDNSKIHPLLDTSVERIIYLDKVGDFNQVERGYSINLNISIVNINSQIAAWRTYTMDVYDTYAIRKFGSTIHDDFNLIDDGNQDIILVETNPDNYVFDPTGGTVPYLETFTVECNREISEIKQQTSQGAKICIYEKETKSIVQYVNPSSILKIGNSLFTFGLNGKITYSGVYFLYLPSEIITFANGSSSPMVLIGYTISKSENDDDIHAFKCQTRGKILSTLNIAFYNVGSYNVAINQTQTINVTSSGFQGLNINTRDSSRVYKSDNLTVTIDLGTLIVNNASESKFYNIHIPSGTFYLSDLDSNNTIDISFELVPQDAELPVNGNYVIKFTPSHGSKLIKLDLFKISFCLDKYLDHKSSNVTYSGTSFSIRNLSLQTWSTGFVNLGRTIEYDLGYKMFSYTFRLTNPVDELGNYTIIIPADSFSLDDGFNNQLICNYDILEFVEEDNKSSNSYLYDMLKIVPKNNYNDEIISFKKDNTIFINSTKLSTILFSPVISLVDYKNNDKLTGEIFSLNDHKDSVLEMYCSLRALLSSNEWIYDDASYNSLDLGKSTPGFAYGLNMYDLRQFYKLYNLSISGQETDGLFFKNKIINELPRSMFLKLEIKLDGNYVAIETNILFLEDSVYEKYKENVNWVIEKQIDVYSGEECAHVYVTPNKTNVYDSVVKELVYDPDNDEYKNRCVVELESVTKVRLGNLNNIYNETFKDKQPHGFGLYGLNVFLTGNFYLNNGRSMLDIDNDITMAVGNVNAVKQGLNNLDKQLQQTSELLDQKVSNAEKGVSSTISNFISTNRDAIFKLGLDYSIWSLGSAGISLYNPNVKYKYNEYGNKVVDETTVGDFDEGILILADKLRINNYYSVTIDNVIYYKVIVTSANPKDWIYPNQDLYGLFYPRMRDDTNSDRPRTVPFKYFYIRQDLINNAVLCSTLGSADGSILRYVYIMEDDLGNPYCPEPGNLGEKFTSYAFNSFYSAYTQSSNSNERITFYTIEDNTVTSAQVNDLVWFLPYTIQAALFNNGKIYAKYISTEGLEVEHLIAIPKDLSPWELAGSRNVRRNPEFDISKPITESNYPVICDSIYEFEGNNQYASQPEKTVPFVVISGYTGKITARSADIYGSITVGDRTGTNSKYIVLSDNVDDSAVESGRTPAMYIMSNDNGYPRVIAKFSGDDEGNLLSRYTNLEEDDTSSISLQISIAIQNTYILGELITIPNKTESNNVDTLGYPIYSENNSIIYNLICTIPHSDKMRNLRFNITPPTKNSTFGLDLNNSGSTTFKFSLANQGKVYGFITYNVDYFIKQGTTMDANGTKIGSTLTRVFINDRTGNMSYSNLVPTLLNNVVINPSELDYIVYYRCWVDMDCYLMYRYLLSDSNKFPLTIDYSLQGINISITPSGLSYFSLYTGNGMSSGYNKDNYFGSYYRMDSNSYPGMITGFKSGGIGMLFDRTNPYYLLPNNFMIPMYIPILYFRGGPYEDTQLLLPSTNPENCYLTVTWKRDTDYDSIYNAYQEYDSDLINFYAMRGDRAYEYESTYSDGTPRERSGNIINIHADAVYEFCYYKLDKLLHDNYGIGISTKNVRVNLTRLWGSSSGTTSYYNGEYNTDQEDTGNSVKVDVITGRTVYISTYLPNYEHWREDLRFNFQGSIEIYLNPNHSSGQTVNTNYTQELMTYKRETWNEIYTGFYNRYIALTTEQQQLLNLNTMLQSFNTDLLTLNGTSVKETVDSIELNLLNLAPLIESVLSNIENESSSSENENGGNSEDNGGNSSSENDGGNDTPPSTPPSSDDTDD